jgi:hypothetical protein
VLDAMRVLAVTPVPVASRVLVVSAVLALVLKVVAERSARLPWLRMEAVPPTVCRLR